MYILFLRFTHLCAEGGPDRSHTRTHTHTGNQAAPPPCPQHSRKVSHRFHTHTHTHPHTQNTHESDLINSTMHSSVDGYRQNQHNGQSAMVTHLHSIMSWHTCMLPHLQSIMSQETYITRDLYTTKEIYKNTYISMWCNTSRAMFCSDIIFGGISSRSVCFGEMWNREACHREKLDWEGLLIAMERYVIGRFSRWYTSRLLSVRTPNHVSSSQLPFKYLPKTFLSITISKFSR